VSWYVSAGLRRFGFDDLHEQASKQERSRRRTLTKHFHETAAAGAAAGVFLSDSDMAS